jgi:hypothetical protein
MQNPDGIPDEWHKIAEQSKKIFDWSEWSDVAQPTFKTASPKREALNTNMGEKTDLIRQLADNQGVSILGAQLRINAFAYRREFELTATLEATGGRNGVTIARVDAWPSAPHSNYKARKHGALRHLPRLIHGHHAHRFPDNAKLGRKAFTPSENLPAAVAIDGRLTSFRDFLSVVASEFGIDADDMDAIQPPPTWELLL